MPFLQLLKHVEAKPRMTKTETYEEWAKTVFIKEPVAGAIEVEDARESTVSSGLGAATAAGILKRPCCRRDAATSLRRPDRIPAEKYRLAIGTVLTLEDDQNSPSLIMVPWPT
jgi:hypothetical protein